MSICWLFSTLFKIDENAVSELDAHIIKSKLDEEKLEKETEEFKRLSKMPFYLMIQEPGQEEILKRVEANQKDTFLRHSVKKWGIKKEESLELFQEFFTEFLNGKIKSIYYFLKERGYKIIGGKDE